MLRTWGRGLQYEKEKEKTGGTRGNLNKAALSEDMERVAGCDYSNLPYDILSSAASKFPKQGGSLGFTFLFLFFF